MADFRKSGSIFELRGRSEDQSKTQESPAGSGRVGIFAIGTIYLIAKQT